MKGFKFLILLLVFVVSSSCAQQKKYITYTVKKGETIKSIAKNLNMKTKDLLRLNPDVGRKPSANTVIIIPNKNFDPNKVEEETTKIDTVEKDTTNIDSDVDSTKVDIETLRKQFVLHKVKKGDTYYSLTRAYNVSQKQLDSLNPELVDGLKLDTLLKIKGIEEDEEEILVYQDSIAEGTTLKFAMLLPFRAYQYDTIEPQDIFKTKTLANITTDLYLGANLAIDSLSKQGVEISLKPFDTGKKSKKIRTIVEENDFDAYDAVIGPLYSEEIPVVAYRTRKVPVVFPVYSKKQNSFTSSRIIKTYADKDVHQQAMVDVILEKYENENLLIIGDSSSVSIKRSNQIKSILLEHDSIQEAKIIHPNNGYIRKDIIINSLKAEVGNWVVLATDNNVIASDAINSLISLPTEDEEEDEDEEESKKKKKSDEPEMQILPDSTVIKVFAFDKARTFDKIDNNKLAKLGFVYTSDVYSDEYSPQLQAFIAQYRRKNHAYPSYYAIKGFDIVYDLGMRLASGNYLKDTFKEGTSYRLESVFEYSKELYHTTNNKGVFVLEYNPDLTITRLK